METQPVQIDDVELEAGRAAARYINSLIRGASSPTTPRTRQQSVEVGERRIARFRRFLKCLGNPQDSVRYVHVGGTSGKGSVAAKVAAGLTASGLTTGLHCTPYLQTVLEKFECDGRLARPAELAELVSWIRPHVDAFARNDPGGRPTYGMVCVALTLEFFRRRGVDIAVMEVGSGGRYDLTNVVKPELAIITSVGADHLKSLGGTLENVAWHKAGIFKPGAMAMAGSIPDIAREPLRQEAKNIGVRLVEISSSSTDFRETNCVLARAVLSGLNDRGFSISDHSSMAISQTGLAGRFEQMPDHRVVYLDGAHNRDKAHALAMLLQKSKPSGLTVGVFGMVGYRAAADVLPSLLPQVSGWVATEPQVYGKNPLSLNQIAATGAELGRPPACQIAEPKAAMDAAIDIAGPGGAVVCAGSVYLAGNLRALWYPTDAIERQGTMWPTVCGR
ncbi:MAG: hypothetical protein CL790_00405 [Chloroflexi bacterium]|nr:hypothetical protein [Chloroflexota bacterium]HCU74018.1 hypothetical protein [Chloroflexota bacterium]